MNTRDARIVFAIVVTGLLPLGCSGGGGADLPKPGDPAESRKILEGVLDRWKKGEKPALLKTATPPIVVQDADWTAGATLLSYEITGEATEVMASRTDSVKLTIKDKKGKEARKDTAYLVNTNPSITVFREL